MINDKITSIANDTHFLVDQIIERIDQITIKKWNGLHILHQQKGLCNSKEDFLTGLKIVIERCITAYEMEDNCPKCKYNRFAEQLTRKE